MADLPEHISTLEQLIDAATESALQSIHDAMPGSIKACAFWGSAWVAMKVNNAVKTVNSMAANYGVTKTRKPS